MASRPLEYFLDTGEPFADAVRRLAKTHTAGSAALELGYANGHTLQRALKSYGIVVEFQRAGMRYVHQGISDTLPGHAKRLGIDLNTLYKRVEKWGWCDRVFSEPVKDKHKYYEMGGVRYRVRELAAIRGLPIATVYERAKHWGWCDRVFNEPLNPRFGKKGRRMDKSLGDAACGSQSSPP